MKIRIADKDEISDQDIADARERDEAGLIQKGVPDLTGIQEIVLSQQVADQLEEAGISQDEFVAMLLKHAKATQ